MEFNHDRSLSDFQREIDILVTNGYKPIAVSQLFFEDTFVFQTNEEAVKAYHQFEKDENENSIGEINGWWYGREDFETQVKSYEANSDVKVLTHWLL